MTTGTTAKLLAEKLGFGYIDSGAMYRAVSMCSARKAVLGFISNLYLSLCLAPMLTPARIVL